MLSSFSATHSSVLLDALDNSELYLLSPAELAAGNQLARGSNSTERLEVALVNYPARLICSHAASQS